MRSIQIPFAALIASLATAACGSGNFSEPSSGTDVDTSDVASSLAADTMSQPELIHLDLNSAQQKAVSLELAELRGWETDESSIELIKTALFTTSLDAVENRESSQDGSAFGTVRQALGSCTQKLEQVSGTTGQAFVAGIQPAAPNECGPDTDDKILIFNKYWSSVDPDNIKYYSGLWTVRSVLSVAYPAGLSSNGLCTNTVHTCMGTKGQVLGNDLYTIYIHY